MEPIDYRNETWQSLQRKLSGIRLAVWDAWKKFGPGTTREISDKAGIDILTFRPRTTELYQMGFVELVSEQTSNIKHQTSNMVSEGRYRAVDWLEVMRRFHKAKREATQRQLELI